MTSRRAKYILERENIHTIENDSGYVEFLYLDKQKAVQITDIVVDEDKRKSGIAKSLADQVAELAKKEKYETLIGTVCLDTKNCGDSMRVLLAYGMEPYAMQPAKMMIYFKKSLEEGK